MGVPDSDWGERLCAAWVPVDGHACPTGPELRAWGKERLAPYKVPHDFAPVDGLPRNAMGKVRKDTVSDMFTGSEAPPDPGSDPGDPGGARDSVPRFRGVRLIQAILDNLRTYWIVHLLLLVYTALLAYHAWSGNRKTHGVADYFVGGRSMGPVAIGLSFFATLLRARTRSSAFRARRTTGGSPGSCSFLS